MLPEQKDVFNMNPYEFTNEQRENATIIIWNVLTE